MNLSLPALFSALMSVYCSTGYASQTLQTAFPTVTSLSLEGHPALSRNEAINPFLKNFIGWSVLAAFPNSAHSDGSEKGDQIRNRSWCPDNGNGTFTNPLMWGDWPDPDVIRVGDDFYLTSTSMHYVPGCPIAQSKDLVNWTLAGYAVSRYNEDPRWDMKGGQLYLNGSWATTLRYHNGQFYLGSC